MTRTKIPLLITSFLSLYEMSSANPETQHALLLMYRFWALAVNGVLSAFCSRKLRYYREGIPPALELRAK